MDKFTFTHKNKRDALKYKQASALNWATDTTVTVRRQSIPMSLIHNTNNNNKTALVNFTTFYAKLVWVTDSNKL